MRHADLLEENCAIARSAGILGERWVWVILRQAFNGARRFEDFQRGIGLARNVLTERLNWLVDHVELVDEEGKAVDRAVLFPPSSDSPPGDAPGAGGEASGQGGAGEPSSVETSA